ncbi:aldo/keto reductase [Sporolactobacillus shoreicorticis]|uniref:Aldo/keto reductase n=1 Tax=Sporolactobacillus shoreicorticis TaxID=1923877 RepID=A0ABW5S0P9_9BACL|nr:aldo/keto reductase [Sporolactobacillus shoreicorticis]MCO7127502.1 aldo/keto reductase [Sporolactobacillus shoreicorticis]
MEYRTVGKTGIKVSSLAFGTMSFGSTADEATSKAMFERCREAGINFFDSADVYAGGLSEEILGRLIKDARDDVVITSKVFWPTGQAINARGLSRRHIMRAVEASLQRLQTDYIDFYIVHDFDENTSIEETMRALDDLKHQGKILHASSSNWAAWQMMKAQGIAAKELLGRFEIIEPMYSLVKRQAEVEILPMAQTEQIGVIAYSPLGGGLLTGKYGVDKHPTSGRLIDEARYSDRYAAEENYETADRFTAYAKAHNVAPATLAVAWVKANPSVTAPIIGARNLKQLEDSLAAADFKVTQEMYAELAGLSRTPAPANDRTEVLTGKWS